MLDIYAVFAHPVRCWRRLVAWAAAVRKAGGWDKARTLVVEDLAGAEEAGLSGWMPNWDMNVLLYQTAGLNGDLSWLLAPLAGSIQDLLEAGVLVQEITLRSVMLDFVHAFEEMQVASDVTHKK